MIRKLHTGDEFCLRLLAWAVILSGAGLAGIVIALVGR